MLASNLLDRGFKAVVARGVLGDRWLAVQLVQLGVRCEVDVDGLAVDGALELGNDRGAGRQLAGRLGVLVVFGVGDADERASML